MLDWQDARRRVLDGVSVLPAERIPVQKALGRFLAEPVIAVDAMPPFDNSAMDGFAVRAGDLSNASEADPATLKVTRVLGAGDNSKDELNSGEAVRVMTGAPIPPGADAVVQVEWTEYWDPEAKRARPAKGDGVRIFRSPEPGQNIRRAGESVKAGAVALEAGHPLRAAEIALLLSVGCTEVQAHRRPRVAVLSTGNELIESGPLAPGQIRDSNRPGLLARLTELGFPTVDCGVAVDSPEALEARIRDGIQQADFLLTSGGVSVGDFDYTRDVLDKLGKVAAYQVRVKPGKPQVFGHIGETPVFGLPGNPVSSMVVFEVFVLPALRRMSGDPDPLPQVFTARMAGEFSRKPGRDEFVRVRLDVVDGQWQAMSAGRQGSGVLSSMTRANGYALVPAECSRLTPGDPVSCMFMA